MNNDKNKKTPTGPSHKSPRARSTRPSFDDPASLAAFCDAIIRERGVAKACKSLGLDRKLVWLYLSKHPEAHAAVWHARQETAHALYDECIQIADDAKLDPRDRHIRIETRMRVAGKLNQRTYGEQPRPGTQVNVLGAGEVKLVCDANTRQALIQERQRLLEAGPKRLPEPEQPKLQAGTPIGPTIVPEDPKITQMKSLEGCISEDQARWADLGRFGNH
jgi:hypothetical protein